MISTRGRYALRVMIDLAEHIDEGYIPLQTIAKRQGISEKYLESILAVLSKAGLLDAVRGKGGGYRLSKPAKEYTAFEVLSGSSAKTRSTAGRSRCGRGLIRSSPRICAATRLQI